jgi:hypothetical protein
MIFFDFGEKQRDPVMGKASRFTIHSLLLYIALAYHPASAQEPDRAIGREVSIEHHLQDGREFDIPISDLVKFGEKLFNARFTIEEGAGRPKLSLINGQGDLFHFLNFRDHDCMSPSSLKNNPARPHVFADEWHQFLPLIRVRHFGRDGEIQPTILGQDN